MLGTISETMRNLFGPQAINGALASTVDETVEARATISEATAEIRRRLGERPALRQSIESARGLLESVREQLDLSRPALERVKRAREAEAAGRQESVRKGVPGADPELIAELENAQRDLREARRAESAAHAALGELEARLASAEGELRDSEAAIDAAVWRRRIAEFSLELPEVRAAAAIVSEFATRVAALADASRRWQIYRTPHGTVPKELFEACAITQYNSDLQADVERLQPHMRAECAYLRRLREDPDATLD